MFDGGVDRAKVSLSGKSGKTKNKNQFLEQHKRERQERQERQQKQDAATKVQKVLCRVFWRESVLSLSFEGIAFLTLKFG